MKAMFRVAICPGGEGGRKIKDEYKSNLVKKDSESPSLLKPSIQIHK